MPGVAESFAVTIQGDFGDTVT